MRVYIRYDSAAVKRAYKDVWITVPSSIAKPYIVSKFGIVVVYAVILPEWSCNLYSKIHLNLENRFQKHVLFEKFEKIQTIGILKRNVPL